MGKSRHLDEDDRWAELELPLMVPPAPASTDERRKAKPSRAVGYGACPGCTGDNVAIESLGGHLIWRVHYKATIRGVAMICGISGTRLCDSPARPLTPQTLKCPCIHRRPTEQRR